MIDRPAEVFPVSEYLREELEARGWTATDLVVGRRLPIERVQAILAGAWIAFAEAEALGFVLSVSPQLFLKLQLAYRKRGPSPSAKEE